MNNKQLNFAYKVRHALNENLDTLPSSTIERLASARKTALLAKKQETPKRAFAARARFAGRAGGYFHGPLSWLGRLSVMTPVIVLTAGLITIYQFEQQQRIDHLAEIDALVLSDELPLSAYLDHGFNAYLAKRGQ
jgi:hypothetical protein